MQKWLKKYSQNKKVFSIESKQLKFSVGTTASRAMPTFLYYKIN